jgi:hypothetical protein
MANMARWYVYTALLAAPLLVPAPLAAQPTPDQYRGAQAHKAAAHKAPAHKAPAHKSAPANAPAAQPQPQAKQLPPRIPFTAADEVAATIPGMPDARFWADSIADFTAALPPQPGPWIALSSGGADGAFGAGLLNGLSESGHRPDYAVVTGVSSGALMAPFVFAGPRYDDALRAAYTKITAADVFEVGGTGESFVDSWPLKDLIAKQITPALLADIAAAHKSVHAADKNGGDVALTLIRKVLLASSAIPGGFPPVLIDVEANGRPFQEMHVDGGVGGQFFVAPAAVMAATSDYRLPATALYVVINSGLQPGFQIVPRSTASILTGTVGAAVMVDTRLMIDRAYLAAKRSGVEFNIASIPAGFNVPSRGPFDPDYMSALFQLGETQGKSATPFANEPPAYPGRPTAEPTDTAKTGANK